MEDNRHITLSAEQAAVHAKLTQFLQSSDDYFASLIGSAGTGKTTIVGQLEGLDILAAPTNKAVGVLKSKSVKPCMTIHKFLGLKVVKSKGETKLTRSPTYNPANYSHVRAIGIDESSMIDANLAKYIRQDVRTWGRKYVMIGDIYQLPPVAHDRKRTEVFEYAKEHNRFELLEIARQEKGNPIIQAATGVRDAIIKGVAPNIKEGWNDKGQGIKFLSHREWLDKLQEHVFEALGEGNPDLCRALAWTNEAVNGYAHFLLEAMGRSPDDPYRVGDILTVGEAYLEGDEVVLMTGDEHRIDEILPETHHPKIGYALPCRHIALDSGKDVYVLTVEGREQRNKLLDRAKKEAIGSGDWRVFYALQESYADMRFPYSLTVDKSQGSTFGCVFVDVGNVYKNHAKSVADRCLYTAITRASKAVYLKR